ncbi:K(+)/H(+) antiporter [Coemansia thaxteri]|nr:K(+)/H(+) antiporter [Coemansia thaxteri]
MVLPFGLGTAVSYALFHILMDGKGNFANFLLFCGVAMAITAFPVLARILTEQNLIKTTVGSTAISAAAIDDVVSWCLLALVMALTNNSSGLSALWVFLVGMAWTLFVLFAVRPVYIWYLRRTGCLAGRDPPQVVLFVTFSLVLVSAFFTDAIGIHAIFGAFAIGVIVPHDGGFAIKVTEKIEDVVQVFFLPIYFALSGLKTNLSALSDGKTWGLLILVCAVAFVGKVAGCTLAARASKFSWRESLTLGFLMNCKGLVELIVLNIGLQAGVIDTRIFTMMVVMALVTTFVTSPVVAWLYPPKYQKRLEDVTHGGSGSAKRRDSETGAPINILIVLSRLQQVPAAMALLGYVHQRRRALRVFGLRLLELTGRNSAIMTQVESDRQVMVDPAMAMFRAFARVAALPFHASLAYSERELFADSVLASARDADAELTVVSAFGRGSHSGEVAPGWFESMGWGFTTAQQAAFITALFAKARSPVGVFIDCGMADGGDFEGRRREEARVASPDSDLDGKQEEEVRFAAPPASRVPLVVVPFFGGPDDRQALRLAADLCTHSAVHVLVWRFVRAAAPTSQDVVLREDLFPARPAAVQTPAVTADQISPWDHAGASAAESLSLAATRTGDEYGAAGKSEAAERAEDEALIELALRPRSLGATASATASPLASPLGPGATHAVAAPPSLQPQLAPAATRESQGEQQPAGESLGGIRQKITQKLRLRHQSTRSTDGGGESTLAPGLRATQFDNLTIETTVTSTPLQTFLLRARTVLLAPDLIVCGRSVHVSLPYFSNAQELAAHRPAGHAHTKAERHHALGSVAEYLLGFGTDASLLVVQAGPGDSKDAI